jgi:hypothetical protein
MGTISPAFGRERGEYIIERKIRPDDYLTDDYEALNFIPSPDLFSIVYSFLWI